MMTLHFPCGFFSNYDTLSIFCSCISVQALLLLQTLKLSAQWWDQMRSCTALITGVYGRKKSSFYVDEYDLTQQVASESIKPDS